MALSADPKARERQLANRRDAPPAPRGNRRAEKAGDNSERRVGPLRERHARQLRERYPDLDDLRLALLADRLARLSSANAWIDDRPGVVRDRHGNVYPVVDRIEKWAARVEHVLTELEREQRAEGPSLIERMAEASS